MIDAVSGNDGARTVGSAHAVHEDGPGGRGLQQHEDAGYLRTRGWAQAGSWEH